MYLGKGVGFTRSGNVLTVSGETVGAVHLEQTGYTQARLQGTGGVLDKTFDLQDGYNLLTFSNVALTSVSVTFTGTGTVDWTEAGFFLTDIDLTDEKLRHRPRTFRPSFTVPEGGKFGTATAVVGELAFEWRYLDWDKVDVLEVLFDRLGVLGEPLFVLIPDGFEADRYDVVITSPFDFYPSVAGNFDSGASGALVFSTV